MRLLFLILIFAATTTGSVFAQQLYCPAVFIRTDSINAPPGKATGFEGFVIGRTFVDPTYRWSVQGGRGSTSENGRYFSVRPTGGANRVEVSLTVAGLPRTCSNSATVSLNVARGRGIVDYHASVYVLELDKTLVERSGDAAVIRILAWASDEDTILRYQYFVSGGKVIGTGKEVKWDLSGVESGEYSVTVGADDGCGVCGHTKTAKVLVK